MTGHAGCQTHWEAAWDQWQRLRWRFPISVLSQVFLWREPL